MAKAKIKYMIRDDGVIYIWTPVLAIKKGFRLYDPDKEEPKKEESDKEEKEVELPSLQMEEHVQAPLLAGSIKRKPRTKK